MVTGIPVGSLVYVVTTVVGIVGTALLWKRLARSDGRTPDDRLYAVYLIKVLGDLKILA